MDCYGANPRLLPTKLMKEKKLPAETIKKVPEGHYLQWVNAALRGMVRRNQFTIRIFRAVHRKYFNG
jgi:hypothetical protein